MSDFLNFKKILSFRNVWMALAAFWVVYHHSSFTPSNEFLNFVKSCGAGSVDIFVFASGLGCYFSLKNNPDTLTFLKKRIIRILPTYYICVTPWVIFDGFRLGATLQGVIATYLGIDYLFGIGLQTLWYVNGLVVYYVLVLFFVPFCLRSNFRYKVIGFVFAFILVIPFLGEPAKLMLFGRVPILYLAVCIADYGSKHNVLSKQAVITAVIGMFVGIGILIFFFYHYHQYLVSYGLLWWCLILIVPGMCLSISWLSVLVERTVPIILNILQYIGNCTFEIYLVHMFVFHVSHRAMEAGLFYGTDNRWLLIIAISFILSFIVSAVCSRISKFLSKKI